MKQYNNSIKGFIYTKLYGYCLIKKVLSTNFYELESLEKSFFYKIGDNFRIYLVEPNILNSVQLTLF